MSSIGFGLAKSYGGDEKCIGNLHAYPKTYAGDPQYAAEYFSRCVCGAKRKVTTITEVDIAPPIPNDPKEPQSNKSKG